MSLAQSIPTVLIVDNNVDKNSLLDGGLVADFRRILREIAPVGTEVSVLRIIDEPNCLFDAKRLDHFSHVILTGSRTRIADDSLWMQRVSELILDCVEKNRPLLGICFGHQMIAKTFSKQFIGEALSPEVGWVPIQFDSRFALFKGLNERFASKNKIGGTNIFHSFELHFDEILKLSNDFEVFACSEFCAVQAFQLRGKRVYGLQFHPEKSLEEGQKSIRNIRDQIISGKKIISKNCIFNEMQADSVYAKEVGEKIFFNFLSDF